MDQVLLLFGENIRNVIYDHIQVTSGLERCDIPRKPDIFSSTLKLLFGNNAVMIEKSIIKNLCSGFNVDYGDLQNESFASSLENVRKRFEAQGARLERNEILEFVENMEAKDHVILLYTNPEDKHKVLFTYFKAWLERGEAAAYIASQETPEQIRQAMQRFDINAERYEESGALRVIDYKDWYIIDGKFDSSKTIGLWKNLLDEAKAKGFKGLRVTGEMACFFENKMVKELIEYERALHRTLEIPFAAICAYDQELVAKQGGIELLLDLLKAHSTAIVMGSKAGLVKTM